jgi:predicted DNA-binding transcriptional regulator YafY
MNAMPARGKGSARKPAQQREKKFDAMMKFLYLVNSGETINRNAASGMFGRVVRTVDRYIDTMRKAGFPIAFDEERRTYYFQNGFRLGHADFSPEEVLVFGLAKDLLKKFGPRTTKVLDGIEQKAGIRNTSLPKHIVISVEAMPPAVEELVRRLDRAILDLNQVRITYSAASRGGEQSCRIVNPYYLAFLNGTWYLRAYCRERKELRLFALDRIQELEVLDRHFLPDAAVDPKAEMENAFEAMVDGTPQEVVVRFDKECVPYLKRHKINRNQTETKLRDGRVEIRAKVNGLEGVKLWLYRFIPHVEVVAPKPLKEEMRKALQEAVEKV